jgi:hypothetical protein
MLLVLYQDKNGKICRAEWRLDRKDHDVGGFGQGIDTVFASSVRAQIIRIREGQRGRVKSHWTPQKESIRSRNRLREVKCTHSTSLRLVGTCTDYSKGERMYTSKETE